MISQRGKLGCTSSPRPFQDPAVWGGHFRCHIRSPLERGETCRRLPVSYEIEALETTYDNSHEVSEIVERDYDLSMHFMKALDISLLPRQQRKTRTKQSPDRL